VPPDQLRRQIFRSPDRGDRVADVTTLGVCMRDVEPESSLALDTST
jgi:hypothetical protein